MILNSQNGKASRNNKVRRSGMLAIALISSAQWLAGPIAADDAAGVSAGALVKSMSEALNTLTYEGTFVHMIGGTVETMRILHSLDEGGVRERMTSLNGEAREVYRNDKTVTCIWPGSKSVIVSKSKPRDLLPKVKASILDSEYYNLVLDGTDRVAGRQTHVVHVAPVDKNRYGYRFWIDTESKMLLRMLMLDENQLGLEQVLFTNIEYPDTIAAERLAAEITDDSFSWQEPKHGETDVVANAPDRIVGFSELPAGYAKIAETYEAMPMGDSPLSHVTLSDGMASVSVYVEYVEAAKHDSGSAGSSSMGAVNAYGRGLEQAFVTVVGEVPANVVKAINESVVVAGTGG